MKIKYVKYATKFEDESRTQQQFKDECDCVAQIKRLARHLDCTGQTIDQYNLQGAVYGDFSQIPNFGQYQQIVADSKEKFANLPPAIKERFNNNPVEFFDFCMDENNRSEAVKLGIVAQEIKDDLSIKPVDVEKSNEVGSVPEEPNS